MAFEYRCDWFSDDKLSIHFDNDKTKSFIFPSKRRAKKFVNYNDTKKWIRNKSTSNISWMCIRRVNIWWNKSTKDYEQNKRETKIHR